MQVDDILVRKGFDLGLVNFDIAGIEDMPKVMLSCDADAATTPEDTIYLSQPGMLLYYLRENRSV